MNPGTIPRALRRALRALGVAAALALFTPGAWG